MDRRRDIERRLGRASKLPRAPLRAFRMLEKVVRQGTVPEEATLPVQGPWQGVCRVNAASIGYATPTTSALGGAILENEMRAVLWLLGGRPTERAATAVF